MNGPEEQNFDYVVVGAGSAGAVVAARLSEDPSLRVALIEAGPRDEGIDEVLTLNRWMELLESGYDWDYPIEEQENGNSFMQVVDNAFSAPKTIGVSLEVIVSAGAIDSPKLLMLSGIGPAEHLTEVGIDVLVDAPGVGANLQDHPEAVIQWQAKKPMVTESTQWWEIGVFAQVDEGLDRPDLMMHYGTVNFDMHTYRQGYPTANNVFCLTPNVTHARSRGTVRLRSRDYRDKPRVDPRYFTDPEGYDQRIMTAGLRKAREIVSQAPLAEWAGEELFPGADVQTDEQIQDYIRRTHNTVYHPAGTVRMGAIDDETSPLDPELRAKGVTGLRVADASVMPELVTVNPNLTVYMIGERAAELIASESKTTAATEEPIPARV